MEEAVKIALDGLSEQVGQTRHDISVLRDDLRNHAADDRREIGALQKQVNEWTGQFKIISILIAAILAVIIAYVGKHW